MSAAHFALDNLTAIVDRNHFQNDGPGAEIMRIEPLDDKWSAFGWGVHNVDGHDVGAVVKALCAARAALRAAGRDRRDGQGQRRLVYGRQPGRLARQKVRATSSSPRRSRRFADDHSVRARRARRRPARRDTRGLRPCAAAPRPRGLRPRCARRGPLRLDRGQQAGRRIPRALVHRLAPRKPNLISIAGRPRRHRQDRLRRLLRRLPARPLLRPNPRADCPAAHERQARRQPRRRERGRRRRIRAGDRRSRADDRGCRA